MNGMMLSLLKNRGCYLAIALLLIRINAASAQTIAPGYVPSVVTWADGRTETLSVKLNEKDLYRFSVIRDGKKSKLSTDRVLEIRRGDELWTARPWTDHRGALPILMLRIRDGLDYTIYKELQCSCNNSFRNRRAFVFADGSVVRRKVVGKLSADPLPGESGSAKAVVFADIPNLTK
jgi:hypothetical protein